MIYLKMGKKKKEIYPVTKMSRCHVTTISRCHETTRNWVPEIYSPVWRMLIESLDIDIISKNTNKKSKDGK